MAMVIEILVFLAFVAAIGWIIKHIFYKKSFSLDRREQSELSYFGLPKAVKNGFANGLTKRPTPWEVVVVNLDSPIADLRHFRERGKLFVGGDHFIINKVHLKFSYKKGDPFILHKKHLYYPSEYGLAKHNL